MVLLFIIMATLGKNTNSIYDVKLFLFFTEAPTDEPEPVETTTEELIENPTTETPAEEDIFVG